MAFPQKVTDRLSQAPSRTPGSLRQLLLLSTLLFLLSAASYVGLSFGYKAYLEKSINESKDQIAEFSEQIPLDDQIKLINFYSQLLNLKSLLASHVNLSPTFPWLETNTQINTSFSNFRFDRKGNALSLSATSKTFTDMAEQILAFETLKDQVLKVEVSNISSKANIWQYNLDLALSPSFLTQFQVPIAEDSSENP
ncbi:MAG: hypothetical protein AAB787_03170 [Patescibacteria group bacterium]